MQDIELVDIEDIVPNDNNSLFLCMARFIIYHSFKNRKFITALQTVCDINKNDLKSDIILHQTLRIKLCEYWLNTGLYFDEKQKKTVLTQEYYA
jgi:hypothetical protein